MHQNDGILRQVVGVRSAALEPNLFVPVHRLSDPSFPSLMNAPPIGQLPSRLNPRLATDYGNQCQVSTTYDSWRDLFFFYRFVQLGRKSLLYQWDRELVVLRLRHPQGKLFLDLRVLIFGPSRVMLRAASTSPSPTCSAQFFFDLFRLSQTFPLSFSVLLAGIGPRAEGGSQVKPLSVSAHGVCWIVGFSCADLGPSSFHLLSVRTLINPR